MANDALELIGETQSIPLVLDSPHHDNHYPPGFTSTLPTAELRQAEDAYVDKLFAFCTELGAPLLCARFPRAYIDANRSRHEIDEALLADAWPERLEATERVERGKGLVWRTLSNGEPIYAQALTAEDIRFRIERYWQPYHDTLKRLIDDTHRRFGHVMHLNCHSMPDKAGKYGTKPEMVHPDIVLGDRDGTSCDPAITAFVAGAFEEMGYHCRTNDPYKGVELVRAYSDPRHHRHSLQIELNRTLYMNQSTWKLTSGFPRLRHDLKHVVSRLLNFLNERYDGPSISASGSKQ